MTKYILKLFFLLLIVKSSVYAEITVDAKVQNIVLSDISYYEDKNGELSFTEIEKKKFKTSTDEVASFGFTSSAYWFKIVLDFKKSAKEYKWWLNIAYPLLDKLDLYICDSNGKLIKYKKGGRLRPFKERELKDRNFIFQIEPNQKQIIYLRAVTQSAMQLPIYLQTSESLISDSQYFLILSGIYYGIFILIFFYNIISYLYTRSSKYLLYLLFISAFIVYQLSLDGLGIEFLWSDSYWMIHHGNGTMLAVSVFVLILFSRDFLQTAKFAPKIDKFFIVTSSIMFFVMIAATFRPYKDIVSLIAITAIILPWILIATGIIVYKKKFYPARFYIIGWSSFLLGSVLFVMNKYAWIGGFYFFSHSQQLGSALEMIFLSWALADYQRESKRKYIEKLSELNVVLQENVQRHLVQIRKNDQIMIEKSRLAAMGEMIEQIAHQWRQPLHSLALLNQNLYFKIQLKTATKDDYKDAHDKTNEQLQYMSQTIDDFRNFSRPNKKEEIFYIEDVAKSALNLHEVTLRSAKIITHIFSDKKHKVLGMRHEMMQVFMNLIKNVKDAVVQRGVKNPWLKIYIEDKDEETILRVEDNAGGISIDKIDKVFEPYYSTKDSLEGSGIGLYMSREIIKKSMYGKISVKNSERGAVFTIVLPKVESEKK